MDLAQPIFLIQRELMRAGKNGRGLNRAGQGAAIDRLDGIICQPFRQPTRLELPFFRELHIDRTGEPVLCAELCCTMPDHKESRC